MIKTSVYFKVRIINRLEIKGSDRGKFFAFSIFSKHELMLLAKEKNTVHIIHMSLVNIKHIHKMFRLIFIDFFFSSKNYYIFIGRTLIHFHENLHVQTSSNFMKYG